MTAARRPRLDLQIVRGAVRLPVLSRSAAVRILSPGLAGAPRRARSGPRSGRLIGRNQDVVSSGRHDRDNGDGRSIVRNGIGVTGMTGRMLRILTTNQPSRRKAGASTRKKLSNERTGP